MRNKKRIHLINTSKAKAEASPWLGTRFVGEARDLSHSGDAVVEHPSGAIVFVAGMWLGESAEIKIVEQRNKWFIGVKETLQVISPERVTPACEHHGAEQGKCGGCPWMFVSYEEQLKVKQARVQKALGQIFPKSTVNAILPCASPLNYRSRAQLKTNGREMGYLGERSHELVDISACPVLTAPCQQLLSDLRSTLPNSDWVPTGKKSWLTVDIESYDETPKASVNQRLPFKQVNQAQNAIMLDWLHSRLDGIENRTKAVELFAGSGNLTKSLTQKGFSEIIAVEVVSEAIETVNALELPNVTGISCDLFDEKQFNQFWTQHQDTQLLLLDPPRDGLKQHQGMLTRKSKMRDVLYISCNLATLCRDLAMFAEHRFKPVEIQPIDMFPQTPHIEMMIHLRR